MPKTRHQPVPAGTVLTGMALPGAFAPALAGPSALAPYPPLLPMLLQAALFVVLVLGVFRLAGWVIRRWPSLARPARWVSRVSLGLCAAAVACVLALTSIAPLLRPVTDRSIAGDQLGFILLGSTVALITAPMAWREWARRRNLAEDVQVRAVSSRGRVTWLCVLSGIAGLALSHSRLHDPQPWYGPLQFACLAVFLLTLPTATRRLADALRRPSAPPSPLP